MLTTSPEETLNAHKDMFKVDMLKDMFNAVFLHALFLKITIFLFPFLVQNGYRYNWKAK